MGTVLRQPLTNAPGHKPHDGQVLAWPHRQVEQTLYGDL
jgi:hypothetical protein